jgi:DNA polymerase-1
MTATLELECDLCYSPVTAPGRCSSCAEPSGLTVFDLETGDGSEAHSNTDPRGYVRLAGFTQGEAVRVSQGPDAACEQLLSSSWIAGHNIVHFDLPVLGRVDPRIDVLKLTRERRVLDTMVIDPVLNPVVNDKRAGAVGRILKSFGLDLSCIRHGVPGKTDHADSLAKEHGGFDKIPLEVLEPYLRGDVAASQGLTGVLVSQLMGSGTSHRLREYTWREHRVHAIAATMGAQGLHVDHPLLQRRYWTTADKKYRQTLGLIEQFQIPTTLANGKKAESPARTKEGKAALLVAFGYLGVDLERFPTTPKKAPAFGKEPMAELAAEYAEHPNGERIGDLCALVVDINGARTVYATALDALRSDGRVHPRVVTLQASGRWSISSPGLTVFGKKGIRVFERAVFDTEDDTTVLMAIDLSQIDARSVAVHSQDYAYMDIFGIDPETGKPRDSHAEVAKAVWGDPGMRDRAKPISHGWNYGMQLDKLTEVAGSRAVAEQFDAAMTSNFGRLVAWKLEMAAVASVPGAVMDNGFGRQLRPDNERAFTQGPALMGQGCARDLMMQCLLNIDDFDAKYGTRIIEMLRAQVHDEAVFEVPREHAEHIAVIIESCFNFEWAPESYMRPIQVMASVDRHSDGRLKTGRSWAECY